MTLSYEHFISNFNIFFEYERGGTKDSPIIGYRDETGVDPNSTTETYVAMKLFIEKGVIFGVEQDPQVSWIFVKIGVLRCNLLH